MSRKSAMTLMLGYLGLCVFATGIICLFPLLLMFFYPNETQYAHFFYIPSMICLAIGFALSRLINRNKDNNLKQHQESVVVVLAWVIMIVVSAIPFVSSGRLNWTQAIFEVTSGYTTTGLTVVDIANYPKIFLMYRSITMLFGGVGIVLFVMSVMRASHGMRLFAAEGHNDRLLPNLSQSARTIVYIYLGYILVSAGIYVILGMDWFDALNHSICAYATGGFSTRADNIASFNSPAIEIASIAFMALGGVNFAVHMLLLTGKFKKFFSHCENKIIIFTLVVCGPLLAFTLVGTASLAFGDALRYGIFDVVSAWSTTGFSAGPLVTTLSASGYLILLSMCLIGGSVGSTAGGIKLYRVAVALKSVWWSIKSRFSNNRIVKVNTLNKFGETSIITLQEVFNVLTFIMIYFIIIILGTALTCIFSTASFELCLFEFVSALSNVGYSMGVATLNAHPMVLWTGTVGMLIGRLEIIIVFLAIGSVINSIKARIERIK